MVYRLGDQVGAWSFTGIQGIGLGSASIAGVAVPLSMAWLVNSVWLGRAQERRRIDQEAGGGDPAGSAAPLRPASASSVR